MAFVPADYWPPGPPTGGAALDQTARDAAAAAQATANAAVSTGAELAPLLADPTAAVDWTAGAPGAVPNSALEVLRDTVSIMRWIPVTQRAAIRAGTSTADHASYINAAITYAAGLG